MTTRSDRSVSHITRRDFLYGVAGSVVATHLAHGQDSGADTSDQEYFLARGITESDPRYYPPGLAGMRGSHPGSFEAAHSVRDRGGLGATQAIEDTLERYDLIVVGAGISGLSSAWFFRQKHPHAKILILDNHDDFGGHARRNEFQVNERLLIGYGGTQAIEGYSHWRPEARGLVEALGVKVKKFEQYFDHGFKARHGLSHCIFFDKETFGTDQLLASEGLPDWATYVARTPLNPQAQRDLVRLQSEQHDYLPGMSLDQKKYALERMSFKDFLEKHAKVDPQVVTFFQRSTHGGYGSGIDSWPAYDIILSGLKGKDLEFLGETTGAIAAGLGLGGEKGYSEKYIYHFPDGNASIARLLVRSLIPTSAPGHTMEDIVTARFDYSRLDQSDSAIRLRLNSTAVLVKNVAAKGSSTGVEVTYMRHGKLCRVHAKSAVLAGYNMMIPYIFPELPQKQKDALSYGVKVPLTYTNVLVSNWRAVQKAGLMTCYCPGSYFTEVYLDFPVSIGQYNYSASPDAPAVLHLVHVPTAPGYPVREQYRRGRAELYATPFSVFENHVHDQLGRMFRPHGFDSEKDVQAITVNRWPHGYAYAYTLLSDPDFSPDERPCVIGRRQCGRVSIANSDAGADAETQTAIAEAHRAIAELLA